MSRHLELKGRAFWIVSEPNGRRWIASIGEAQHDGTNLPLGIEASADTRALVEAFMKDDPAFAKEMREHRGLRIDEGSRDGGW